MAWIPLWAWAANTATQLTVKLARQTFTATARRLPVRVDRMDLKMPFKNCDPFKVASEEDMAQAQVRRKAAGPAPPSSTYRAILPPHYSLILLSNRRTSAGAMVLFSQPEWPISARIHVIHVYQW